jgi:glutathione S-transferase
MVRVHHLDNSRSQRILWLLEEIGLPYELATYKRDQRTMLAPEMLRRVHPLGKAPVIEDNGRVIAETGLIVMWIVQHYGVSLMPDPESPAWWRCNYFLHYAEGSAMPPLLLKLVVDRLGPLGWPAQSFVKRQLATHLDYLESELGDSEWFVDDCFSAADIMLSFPLEAAASRAGLNPSRPALWGFLQRIHSRPAYRRALERGGPYAYATAT